MFALVFDGLLKCRITVWIFVINAWLFSCLKVSQVFPPSSLEITIFYLLTGKSHWMLTNKQTSNNITPKITTTQQWSYTENWVGSLFSAFVMYSGVDVKIVGTHAKHKARRGDVKWAKSTVFVFEKNTLVAIWYLFIQPASDMHEIAVGFCEHFFLFPFSWASRVSVSRYVARDARGPIVSLSHGM